MVRARARGSLDLLGPSTTLERLRSGESSFEAGCFGTTDGTTNGAAMRLTPAGISFGLALFAGFIDRVARAGAVPHNIGLGFAGRLCRATSHLAGLTPAARGETADQPTGTSAAGRAG
ncbi:hypothetical protein E3O62_06615 [Cryobacterium sp. TMT2-15-1]|uniref:hypothetical protein n=1 Tax=Cryobacterium sp. TMT2-15-1 TaxID=1259246 RepID=UPI00106D28A5|nr:hypothetical protein [Cryobacterium sp. TMT2-15-1]TFC60374.1 hypothetical protein E3O62_06615 [Cryobacterium sp. TMT2-15-1]